VAKNTAANLQGKWEITYVGEFRDKAVYWYGSSEIAKGVFGSIQVRLKNLQPQRDNFNREYFLYAIDQDGNQYAPNMEAMVNSAWEYCGCKLPNTPVDPGWDTVLVYTFDVPESTGRLIAVPALGTISRPQLLASPRFAIDGFAQIAAFKPK
jgi:hypothetical protein